MKRDGSAVMGVSIFSRLAACGFVLMGGAGRANGFGGPCAPALSKVLVDGDGGGRTTCECWPCCCCGPVVTCSCEVLAASESAVAASSPDASLGICTFRRGRLASGAVLARVGGAIMGTLEVLAVR